MGIVTTQQSIPTTQSDILADNSVPCLTQLVMSLKVMGATAIDGMHASLHAIKNVSINIL